MICYLHKRLRTPTVIGEIFGCSDPVFLRRFRAARFWAYAAGAVAVRFVPLPRWGYFALFLLYAAFAVFYFAALWTSWRRLSHASRIAHSILYVIYFGLTVYGVSVGVKLLRHAISV